MASCLLWHQVSGFRSEPGVGARVSRGLSFLCSRSQVDLRIDLEFERLVRLHRRVGR